MLFSPFTVKVLVRLEFVLILLLTVSSKQKKRGLTKQPVYMISASMVIAHTCDHVFFLGQKRQLVRYPNRQTMGNNDKQ